MFIKKKNCWKLLGNSILFNSCIPTSLPLFLSRCLPKTFKVTLIVFDTYASNIRHTYEASSHLQLPLETQQQGKSCHR